MSGGVVGVSGLGVAGTPRGGVVTMQGDPAGIPIPVTPSGGTGVVEGEGVAGTPAGGLLTVQGQAGMTALATTGPGTNNAQRVEGLAAAGAAPVGNPLYTGVAGAAFIRALAALENGAVLSSQLAIAVAMGRLGGLACVQARGFIATAATAEVAVRGSTYNEPASQALRSVSSSSANDTAAGTGARIIRVTYFQRVGATMTGPFTEDIVMNGVGAVNAVNEWYYIESIEVISSGTVPATPQPAGTITMFNAVGGGGGTLATLSAGQRKTPWAHHYVASGRVSFLTDFYAQSIGAAAQNVFINVRSVQFDIVGSNPCEQQIFQMLSMTSLATGAVPTIQAPQTPVVIVGPGRATMYCTPGAAGAINTSAMFQFFDQ